MALRRTCRNLLKRTRWRDRALRDERYEQALARLVPMRAMLGDIAALARQVADGERELGFDYKGRHLFCNNEGAALFHVLHSLEKMEKMVASIDLPEAPVVLDVGANNGWFTHFLLRHRPRARVFCFEADPALHPLIARNHEQSAQVQIIGRAVGARSDEQLTFYVNPDSRQTSSTEYAAVRTYCADAEMERLEVLSLALDDFVAEHALTHIDVLKLDIQGGEYQALLGAPRTLAMTATVLAEVTFFDPRIFDAMDILRSTFNAFEVLHPVQMGADLRWYRRPA